jgi:hypothetical protein
MQAIITMTPVTQAQIAQSVASWQFLGHSRRLRRS